MGNFAQIEINDRNKWIYFTKKRWIAHVIYWLIVCFLSIFIRSKTPPTLISVFNDFFLQNLMIACFFYIYCLLLIPYFFKRNKKMLFWILVVASYLGICALDLFFNKNFVKQPSYAPYNLKTDNIYHLYLDSLQGYFLNFLFFSMMLFFMEKNEENATSLELEKEKRDIEQVKLDLLKTNISPDFLMRSLKQLKKSAVEEQETTPQAIITFSDLMRYRLYRGRHHDAPLEEEIIALKAFISFLEFEQENNLIIDLQVYGNTAKKNIAPLSLVNILEVICKTKPARPINLNIQIRAEDAALHLELDYHSNASDELFSDLENYGRNYKQLYGERVDFNFENCENDQCKIRMSLPWFPA